MISHSSHPPASTLRERMIEDMSVRGFGEKTRNDYIRNVRAFGPHVTTLPSPVLNDTATGQIPIVDARPASETLVWTTPASQGLVAAGMGLVDCGHVSGLGVRPSRPQAQMGYADRVPNITAGSAPQRVSRGVPILGSTDRHLAAVHASARSERSEPAYIRPEEAGDKAHRSPSWPRASEPSC